MRTMITLGLALATANALAASNVPADHVNFSTISSFNNMNTSTFTSLKHEDKAKYAKQWGMSVGQFKKYLFVKANTPTGALYADAKLDPNLLLGLNALDQGDVVKAQTYITQAVRNEHHRIETLIKAQNMYQKTSQRLFPGQTPIRLKGAKPSSYVSYGNAFGALLDQNKIIDHAKYVLLINAKAPNRQEISDLHKLFNKILYQDHTRIDVYDLSHATDDQIRNWAQVMDVPVSLIQSSRITLNHAGEFVSQIQKRMGRDFMGDTLLRDVSGHYQVINMSEAIK